MSSGSGGVKPSGKGVGVRQLNGRPSDTGGGITVYWKEKSTPAATKASGCPLY